MTATRAPGPVLRERVLGIDPGTHKTGYGIVEASGARITCVATGIIKTREKAPLEQRLATIHEGLSELVRLHAPTSVAVEEVYVGEHVSAALALGHARGVALLVAAQAGLVVSPYAASVVKRTVVGKGGASKDQVGVLVRAILGLRETPGVDATDALAIALTHLRAAPMRALEQSLARPRRPR